MSDVKTNPSSRGRRMNPKRSHSYNRQILFMKYGGYVYILSNKSNSVLYTGVTSNLQKRLEEHKEGIHINAFTRRYNCSKLVYFEGFNRIEEAIAREKQIKAGSRAKKEVLINSINDEWRDLTNEIDE